MKRSIQVAAGLGLAVGVALGASPTASAHEQKPGHKHASKSACQVAPKCRPSPLPKPAGGWPCAKTKTCDQKHHRPVCPPVKPPVKPPVLHPTPKPPAITPHKPVHHVPETPVARAVPNAPQLALTGVDPAPALLLSGGLIGSGVLLLLTGPIRKFTRKAKR